MKRLPLLLLLLLTAGVATAEEKSLAVTGRASLQYMRLQFRVLDPSMKAVRVYAQPSGTLLGVFLNERGPEPMSKSGWLDRTLPPEKRSERFPLAAFEFEKNRVTTVRSDLPKPGDDRVEILIYRGGKKKEEKIVLRDNPTDFKIEK